MKGEEGCLHSTHTWSKLDAAWLTGSGKGQVEGFPEHAIEPSGSIKCWEMLELLHNWRLLKMSSAPLMNESRLMLSPCCSPP
jgi:hypothetical protein